MRNRITGKPSPLRLRMGLLASTAFAGGLLASEAAQADCTPAAGSNVTATCTGTTNGQGPGPGTGYGAIGLSNLNVTVVSGASVSGNVAVRFGTGSVTNSGTIAGGSQGINATTVTVTNSGSITGANIGIVGTTTTVTNSGTITGSNFSGINSSTAYVINSGTITSGHFGIDADNATVSNSGTITGGLRGIILRAGNGTVTNSGVINGGSWGITAIGPTTVINSGTISGQGLAGLSVAGSANVTNSGTIIGGNGTAISFGTASDSLTVLPGARFGGLVNFGGGADKVNFGPGSWILNTANFDATQSTVTTNGGAYFVTPNKIVAADLSGFGAVNRAVMDITGWIASVLPDVPVFEPVQGGSTNAFAAIEAASPRHDYAFDSDRAALAYAPTFKGGTVSDRDGNSVWAKGFGGRRDQATEVGFIGSVTVGYGGAIGYDRQITPTTRLGGFVGGSTNETRLNLNAGGVDTDALFGGLYARNLIGPRGASFLDLSLIGGRLDNVSTRNIGGGLAFETARASYDGWFVNLAATLGHRFALDGGYTFTPALKLRYVAAGFGGYTETSSSANLGVGARNLQAFEERAEMTLANTSSFASGRLGVRVTGGLLAQQRSGDASVNIALVGQNFIAATPDAGDVLGIYGGAGLDWQIGRVALFAAGEIAGMDDSTTSFAGKGGLRVVW